jgi:hypothetical protein
MSYNKNLKLYVQNINKTSKKGFYHSSLQVYSNEIYEINRKITQEGIPLEKLRDQIEFLKKKYSVFKNKEKSNAYLTLLNLTDTITYKTDANTYEKLSDQLNKDLLIATNDLNNKIQQLADCLKNNTNRRWFNIPELYLVKNISINKEYLIYIREFGMPQNGIFIESLLDFIRITLM